MVTRKKQSFQKGTTLLEVIVAVAVASIALVTFISLVVTSLGVEDYARKMTRATMYADNKFKELDQSGYPGLGTTEGTFEEDKKKEEESGVSQQGQREDEQETDIAEYSYRLFVSQWLTPEVRQVELEVLWDKGKRSITLIRLVPTDKTGGTTWSSSLQSRRVNHESLLSQTFRPSFPGM